MNLNDVSRNDFPRNFVVKSNHGSGGWVICWDGAQRGTKLPKINGLNSWKTYLVHPEDLVWNDLVHLSNVWVSQNYYWRVGKFPEWAYRNIEPQLLVEEVFEKDGKLPLDYKFHMINGECSFIWVGFSRFDGLKINMYSADWERLSGKWCYRNANLEIPKPNNLFEMLDVARKLSEGLDFARVDLYETDKGIKFGEVTNYPFGGLSDIEPRELSIHLANAWKQNY